MTTIRPYEILQRFDGQSWHVSARTKTVYDDGTERDSDSMPITGLVSPVFEQVRDQVNSFVGNSLHAEVVAERDSLQSQLTAVTTERDAALSEKASLQTQLDSANTTIETLTSDKATLETNLTEVRADKAAIDSEKDQLQASLDSANERIAVLESRIAELTAEPEVPIVSRRQARLALLQMDLLGAVETSVAQSPKAVQIEYEADVWRRDNQTLIAMAKSLGMGDEQIDQFFALASSK